MQYCKNIATAFCVAALGSGLSAQESWDGFYAGLSLDAARTVGSISGTNAHDRKTQNATLGAYAGFNRSARSGLLWGGEIALSPMEGTANKTGAGLGTTDFNGKFLLNPRFRAGVTTGNLYIYATAGLGISNAVLRDITSTSKDYAIGISYGGGAEMKLGNNWSTRLDVSRVDLGLQDQKFGTQIRDTKVKIDKITLGLTKSF